MKLEKHNEALEIKLEVNPGSGYEGDAYGFDLLTRTIVNLIEEFDADFAQKEGLYWEDNQFYASILSAIARHCMVNEAENTTLMVHDVLVEMVKRLSSAGLLQEEITSGPYDYDE